MWKFFIFAAALYAASVEGETYYGQIGTSIKIKCGGNGKDVSWKFNDILIFSVDKSGKTRKGSSKVSSRASPQSIDLHISNLESTDKGKYSCTSEGKTTDHKLEIVTVSVSANPPSPLLLSGKATLICAVQGIDNPEIKWSNSSKHESTPNPLSLNPVETSDSGTWTCLVKAQNMDFKASLDIDVIGLSVARESVTVKQGSAAALRCSLSTQNMGSLRVVRGGWRKLSAASDGDPHLPSLKMNDPTGLHWDSTGTDESKVNFPKGKLGADLAITLLKVTSGHAGRYECSVEFEGKGTLQAVVALHVETRGGGGSGTQTGPSSTPEKGSHSWLGLNMWIWVGVGVGSLVLIVLVVAVVLIYQSNKRKKMRLRKLRSVRKPLTANDYCQCNRQPRGGDMNRTARGIQRQHAPENIRMNGGHGGRPYV